MIVHGDADNLVNISGSEKALSVYEESDAFAKLVTISGAGHIFFNAKAQRAGNIRYIGLSQAGRVIRGNYMDKNRKKLFINIGITVAVIIIAAILGAIVGELLLDNLI